ncbi:MAG: HAD-IA family hydrolase [Rhodobacteraceae bacterium]|nr:HAD-IA family hydrolase [Paracoccaceae bacterium]
MKLKALIFDVDGTLAETEEAHRAAFNTIFAQAGLGWKWSMDDYHELLKISGGKERMRAFQESLPQDERLGDAEIAALHKEKTAIYGEILARGELELRPGVDALIKAGRKAGLRIAVATTTNTPNVEALTQCCWRRPASQVFDVVAAGDQVSAKKPAPDVFNLALERLELAPDVCVAFEDSLNGVRSARGANLPVVVTPSIYTDRQDFSAAQLVRPTLEGLSLSALAVL